MDNAQLIKLIYPSAPKGLHFLKNDVTFWIDGQEHTFKSTLSSELLHILIKIHPTTIGLENLFGELNKFNAVGNKDTFEKSIHKIVHSTRHDLLAAGLKLEVIKNIRSLGYRLGAGWMVEPSSLSLFDHEIHEIKVLIEKCIEYVKNTDIIYNHLGLSYIECNTSLIKENIIILDRVGRQLIHCTSEKELLQDVLGIKSDLTLLMSYVVFWRIGHRIKENEWKEDYEKEVLRIYSDIEMRVLKIKQFLKFKKPEQGQLK